MNSEIFKQDLSVCDQHPGGPFIMTLLFRQPPPMPDKAKFAETLSKRLGRIECFTYDDELAGFAALDHVAEFSDGKVPVLLMLPRCTEFDGRRIDGFTRSQMWDCQGCRDEILDDCRFSVISTDLMAAGLPTEERANLDMDFMEALVELYPDCVAFYFNRSGKLFDAETIRSNTITGPDRFIRYAVNVRFFTIQGTDDMLVDTLGMGGLCLPDLQYHFHGIDPNSVVNHAYNTASYILTGGREIKSGETIDGIKNEMIDRSIQWMCRYEAALIQPEREVIDINMGVYASGNRD